MPDKSKKQKLQDWVYKNQLRWACIRLNKHYRKFWDQIKSEVKKDDFLPWSTHDEKCYLDWGLPCALPYDQRLLRMAFRDRLEKLTQPQRKIIYSRLVTGLIGRPLRVKIDLPDFLDSKRPDGIDRLAMKADTIHLEFLAVATKEEVHRYIDYVFEKVYEFRKRAGIEPPTDKVSKLSRQLDVYELVEYEGLSLYQIAKQKRRNESQKSAENRITKQYDTAKDYVENGLYLDF